MMPRRFALAAAGLAAGAAFAQDRAPWDVRAWATRDALDSGYQDWREAGAQLAWRPGPGQAYLGGFRQTERFGLDDREGVLAAYVPLAERGPALHLEGTWSATHRVLARDSLLGELSLPFAGGWVASAGWRASRYSTGDVQMGFGGIERYVGDLRFGYTAYVSRPEGAGWSPTHRVVASWMRGELTHATLSVARGREVENLGPPTGLVVSDVRNATLTGGYEFAPGWGLTFELGWQEQGNLYTRRTASIGARHLF